jgi:hypothetical protein
VSLVCFHLLDTKILFLLQFDYFFINYKRIGKKKIIAITCKIDLSNYQANKKIYYKRKNLTKEKISINICIVFYI